MRNRVRKVDFVARPKVCAERESIRNIVKEWMTTDLAVSERLQQDLYISPGRFPHPAIVLREP
jgi:hypothetical protein